MATKANPIGPTARRTGANIERIRKARGMSQKDLSIRMGQLGLPTLATVISKTERGERRVDVDDLVVFALALNVSPTTLIMPESASEESVELTDAVAVSGAVAWAWAESKRTAMDWEPGEGVSLAGSGADPAIAESGDEAEQEFAKRQLEYQELSGPIETRRASAHQAVRNARLLTDFVIDIVTPDPEVTLRQQKSRIRTARRRLEAIRLELDDLEESVTEYEVRDLGAFEEPGRLGHRYTVGRKDRTGPEYPIETWKETGPRAPEGPGETGEV